MAVISAFKGLRFTKKAGEINTLVCPPYDIISPLQRKSYEASNPNNIISLELPDGGENRYKNAGKKLSEMINEGILKQDEHDSLYIYEEEFTAYGIRKKVKGLITLVRLEEFSKNIVLPHEETLSKAKADRFNLMCETFCNFSQVYSLYMDGDKNTRSKIESASQYDPDIEFSDDDNVIHRLWCITDTNVINAIIDDFKDRQLFIADGHHRYETALNFRNKLRSEGKINDTELGGNYIMMDLVDIENDGLVVFPTHRLIRDVQNFSEENLIKECKLFFDIETKTNLNEIQSELMINNQDKCFAMYTGNNYYYKLKLKDSNAITLMNTDKSDAYNGLDVTILHSLVLERTLHIDKENMAKQINLTYTRSIEEAIAGVKEGTYQAAFILNPTKVSEIKDVAAAGEKMPQKSTYFYPKLITGLVMNKMV
ncbi:MAG: DUF1015 domain-containing protein [Bacillota bacterium]|nr:DUF1015 domain-containing protein [Bacillota bacterium]